MPELKKIIAIALLCIILTKVKSATANSEIPTYFEIKGQKLILNGSGVRQKYWTNLFTQSLYLKQKSKDGHYVINANELMSIKIIVTSDLITSKRLEENLRSEFNRITNGKTDPYKDRIETLVKAFQEKIKKGDVYDIIYDPESGLNIYKNNVFKTNIIGLDFKKMMFSTWFGDDPADENVKKAMLNI